MPHLGAVLARSQHDAEVPRVGSAIVLQLVHQNMCRRHIASLDQALQLSSAHLAKYNFGLMENIQGSIVGLHSRCRHLLLHNTSRSGCVALKHQLTDQRGERADVRLHPCRRHLRADDVPHLGAVLARSQHDVEVHHVSNAIILELVHQNMCRRHIASLDQALQLSSAHLVKVYVRAYGESPRFDR